jgi:myo-inositol-1(or 4)-monophosphatase
VRDRRILSDIQTIPLKTRRLGSIALELAYVADATFDLLFASKRMEQNLYDVAAGILLVTEAGGRVTNGDGNRFAEGDRELIASNGALHDQAVALVAERGEATT